MAKCIESTIGGAILRFQVRFHEVSHTDHDITLTSPTRPHATDGLRPPRRELVRAHGRRAESGRGDRRHDRRVQIGWRSRFAAARQSRCSDWIRWYSAL